MRIFLSGKGSDINEWRSSQEFAASFRDALIAGTAFSRHCNAEKQVREAGAALERLAVENDSITGRLDEFIAILAETGEPDKLKAVTRDFYTLLYSHFDIFQSARAFYQIGSRFLQALTTAVARYAVSSMGTMSRSLPELAIVGLGPAGRMEFSPFCELQMLIVHGSPAGAESESIALFGTLLHDGFEKCGIQVDNHVTPHNPAWRGCMVEWERRIRHALDQGSPNELVDILRLTDQYPLSAPPVLYDSFRQSIYPALRGNRHAMQNLVSHMQALSNGLGIMGGLRLEKNGSCRGLFDLLTHALLPLSAVASSLTMIKKRADGVGTPRRIAQMLECRALDVETTERLLHAWHTLNELRLAREFSLMPGYENSSALYIAPETLHDSLLEDFRDALEAIGTAQRQTAILFSSGAE